MFSLVRSRPPDDRDIRDLRARVSEQGALLDARLARLTQLESELDAFKVRYRHEVGRRHDELDELEYATAELELAELARQLGEEPTDRPTRPARNETSLRLASPRTLSASCFATSRKPSTPISPTTSTLASTATL